MVDTGFYLKDDTIKDEVYNGNAVPSINTVKEATNDGRKRRCDVKVNKPFGWTTNQADPNGFFEDYALMIYKRIVAGEDAKFKPDERRDLMLNNYAESGDNSPGLSTSEDHYT